MKIDGQRKIIIGFFGLIMLFFIVGGSNAASVDVDGWTFTADLGDQWHSDAHATENDDVPGYDSHNMDYLTEHNMVAGDPGYDNWKGILLSNAFWLPKDNAKIDPQHIPYVLDPKKSGIIAVVNLRVHAVPADMLDWETHDLLLDLSRIAGISSVKDVEFNGHPALLQEEDSDSDLLWPDGTVMTPAYSSGNVAVMMTGDTVVQIEVTTKPESGLSAWDVIEKFTISKSN